MKMSPPMQAQSGPRRTLISVFSGLTSSLPGNLDPELSSEIMALFRRFQSVGVTVLIATHDISLINRMQLRIMRLEDGGLTDDGATYGGY